MTAMTVREELHRLVDDVPVGPPPIRALLAGRRRRTARRTAWLAAAAVLVVTGGGVAAVQLVDRDGTPSPGHPLPSETSAALTWQQVADAPLSPRYDSFGFWTGSEAVFVGGTTRDFVGGPFTLPELRDGAAYNAETGTWRTIAPAPAPLGSNQPSALGGSTLVVRSWSDTWLAYDIGADQWRRLPPPPVDVPQPTLALRGHRLYVFDVYVEESLAPVQVLDLTTDEWTQLPRSPHEPVLDQRTLVATPQGIVVMGDDVFPRQAGRRQETARAELWDGTRWRRFPDSDVMGDSWQWTGERIVSGQRTTEGSSERGGEYTFRAGALDPATGEWSQLPWLPGDRVPGLLDEGWPRSDGPLVFSGGYVYDDRTGESTPVVRPRGFPVSPTVVLGGGRIITFGGFRVTRDQGRIQDVAPTAEAWILPLPSS